MLREKCSKLRFVDQREKLVEKIVFFLLKVDEFLLLTDEEKTKLKWNFLLEKFRFGIEVKEKQESKKFETIEHVYFR